MENRYRFHGREWDGHRGDYYYRWRQYIPEWGSFTAPDPVISLTDPEGCCNYIFCSNHPINYTDPTGLWLWGYPKLFKRYWGRQWRKIAPQRRAVATNARKAAIIAETAVEEAAGVAVVAAETVGNGLAAGGKAAAAKAAGVLAVAETVATEEVLPAVGAFRSTPTGEYLEKSGRQVVLGNYTEDVTLVGTSGQVLAGLTGLDIAGDVRDIAWDVQNWEFTWGHVGQTAIDGVAILPVIGALKYADESGTLLKHGSALILDRTKDGRRVVRHADDAVQAVKNLIGDKDLWRIEEHHVFLKCLGGADDIANKLPIAAYAHRGAEVGFHSRLFVGMGVKSYDELKAAWRAARTAKQRTAFLGNLRGVYADFFKGSSSFDEIMELVDTGLATAP